MSASLVSFFPSLDPPGKTILSTAEEISTRLLKLHSGKYFFLFYHTRGGFNFKKSLLIFCFDTLDLKLFDFQTAKGKENLLVNANLKWRLRHSLIMREGFEN